MLLKSDIENFLFNQAIPNSLNNTYRIAIKYIKKIYAELSIYLSKNEEYHKIFSCPAIIGKNGIGKQIEGDNKTPLGTFKIKNAYGIKNNPGIKITYTKITNEMYWCCSSNNINYNTLIYNSTNPNDEHLIDYPTPYEYLLDIGYNPYCVPYIGSAIFLHCWERNNVPTAGCIAVSKESMIKILQTITPRDNDYNI